VPRLMTVERLVVLVVGLGLAGEPDNQNSRRDTLALLIPLLPFSPLLIMVSATHYESLPVPTSYRSRRHPLARRLIWLAAHFLATLAAACWHLLDRLGSRLWAMLKPPEPSRGHARRSWKGTLQ
jgi:hypothetical protein